MPKRIALSTLNASTLDILNVIRQNASYEYQQSVPVVTKTTDIPKVGEILYGTPALANQFINALVNRIAMVRIKSATFNNPYARLKKGYLEFGETVEEIFVDLIKPLEFSAEKAQAREHKRYMPDVKSAFHVMNWRVMYPITIQDDDLKMAFTSIDGVRELIEKIVDSIYRSAEYDEFLLFKYLIIKAVSHGKMYPVAVDTTNDSNSAIEFRAMHNKLMFMSDKYNSYGVKNVTPNDRQVIFMDSDYNARFDVNVLASAFNMDKADFIGKLELIDNWTTFDNERFDIIRENSDGLEEVTDEELELMQDVVALIVDEDWFQVYDNENKMTEQYTASGLYWNYFYHVWKTLSTSPFANAVVFVTSDATISTQALTFRVFSKDVSDEGVTTMAFVLNEDVPGLAPSDAVWIQTDEASGKGIAVHPYGGVIFPQGQTVYNGVITVKGTEFGTDAVITEISTDLEVGDTVTFASNR